VTGTIVQLSTSDSATYALTADGSVWAWGVGTVGQLGNGDTESSPKTAVQVAFPAGVVISQLSSPMPYNSGLAIDSTGHAWGWGYNKGASMCLKKTDLLKPKKVPGLSGVTLATGQGMHSLFDANGTVVACGLNPFGELGTGTKDRSLKPIAVVGLPEEPVLSLESSWHGSGALMADGTYYDWGFNRTGQMGLGNTKRSITTAQPVSLPTAAVQVFQGGSGVKATGQTVALLSDGTVWAWGAGESGELGNGTTVDSDVPVQVSVPDGVTFVEVASGGAASYAVDSTGTIWSWGRGEHGALGNGTSGGIVVTPTAIAGGPFTYVTTTAFNVAAF
jgi:alpha-tubulin suppressor-like RCC1 family protein